MADTELVVQNAAFAHATVNVGLVELRTLAVDSAAFTLAAGDPTRLDGWSSRKLIALPIPTADLVDFPNKVPIVAGSPASIAIGAACRADGFDLRFTAIDGVTLLPYERESFAVAGGEATGIFWVKSDVAMAGTYIWCYYGNAVATDVSNGPAVFDTEAAVYHMNDYDTSHIHDSSANANHGTKKAANEPIEAAGKIAKGQDFDGADDFIDCGHDGSLDTATTLRISAWVYPHDVTGAWGPIAEKVDASVGDGWWIFRQANNLKIEARYGAAWDATTAAAVFALNEWARISIIYDGTDTIIYVGGVEVAREGHTGDIATNIHSLIIGLDAFVGGFDGLVDEVRLSTVVPSAAWEKYEYDNQNPADGGLTWGAEEESKLTLNELRTLIIEPELAINGTMEDWASATDLTTWNELLYGTSTINREDTELHGGTYACRFDIDASDSYVILYQDVTLTPSAYYQVSLWYKTTGAGHPHLKIYDSDSNVYLTDAGTWSGSDSYIHIPAAADWTKFTLGFAAHASYSNYRMWLTRGSGSASTSIYLDDVSLVKPTLFLLTADSPALNELRTLAVQSADVTLAADALALNELRTLATQSAAFVFEASIPTLDELRTLAVQNAEFALAASVLTLNELRTLVMQDAAFALGSSIPTLNELRTLVMQNEEFILSSSTPTLNELRTLVMNPAVFALAADTVGILTQNTLLVVGNAAFILSCDGSILATWILDVDNADFVLTAMDISLWETTAKALRSDDAESRPYTQDSESRPYYQDSDASPRP